jgi:nucleoside 2-deoxyribosyltransferase
MKSVYLASPLGFAESSRSYMHDLVNRLRTHVDLHNPWDEHSFDAAFSEVATIDSVSERNQKLAEINQQIGRLNREAIDYCDALFAVLDGVDVDSGTASEIGYAFARGKYICGLRTDFRLAGDNPGAIVNLQVEYFIKESGGEIVATSEELIDIVQAYAARNGGEEKSSPS